MMQGAFEPCLSSWERPMMTNADVCVYKYLPISVCGADCVNLDDEPEEFFSQNLDIHATEDRSQT